MFEDPAGHRFSMQLPGENGGVKQEGPKMVREQMRIKLSVCILETESSMLLTHFATLMHHIYVFIYTSHACTMYYIVRCILCSVRVQYMYMYVYIVQAYTYICTL